MVLLSAMVPLCPRASSTCFFVGPSLSALPPRPKCSSVHPCPLGYSNLAKRQYIKKKAWCISATKRELQGQNNSDSVNGSYLDHYESDNLVVYLLKSFLSDIKGFLQFLWEQPSGLKYIEFPSIQSAVKMAMFTLVVVLVLIVFLASIDSGFSFILAKVLRKLP